MGCAQAPPLAPPQPHLTNPCLPLPPCPLQTGMMATVFELQKKAEEWGVGGTPLLSMMEINAKGR